MNQAVSMLIITSAAALLPGVSRFIRLPSAVLEILFGVILGRSLLNVNFSGEWLPFLAELGFLLLMFQAGLEIDFRSLLAQGRKNLVFQLLIFILTFGLSVAFALILDRGIFLALILSTTSLGLVVPTLKESGMIRAPMAQTILIAATLADFLTLLGITFFNMWAQRGWGWHFFYPAPLFIGFGLLLWAGRLWAWWRPELAEKILLSPNPQEQGVRFSLALLFLFVGFSELVHIEPVLGAFMGGCIIAFVFREKHELETKISALGFGFLIPIFFINVGLGFDLSSLARPEQILFTLILLVAAVLVKLIPSLFLMFRGDSLKVSLQTGLLLSSRLSLIVAAASIGLAQGYITSSMKDSIVLLALLTCVLGPAGFKAALGPAQKEGQARASAPKAPRAGLGGRKRS